MKGTRYSMASGRVGFWALRAALATFFWIASQACDAQVLCPPISLGQQTHGGSGYDQFRRLLVAPDGTLLAGGSSQSFGDDRTNAIYGYADFWVYRFSASGALLHERSYGGTDFDYLADMRLVQEGGLILGGVSFSGVGGVKTSPHFGQNVYEDYWILKTDAAGEILWDRNFGGNREDLLTTVLPLSDGGVLVGGGSRSDADGNKQVANLDSFPNHRHDFWVLRLDATGNRVWENVYGGLGEDLLIAAHQAPDGGFLLAGTSDSQDAETKQALNQGYQDFWVVRIDAAGNRLWDRSYGGTGLDDLKDLVPTADGGFLLAGNSSSGPDGTKTSNAYGDGDAWVVRIDADGNQLWDRSFGGAEFDQFMAGISYSSDGFVLGGISSSFPAGNKTTPWYGASDYWVLRLNATGELLWQQAFGGPDQDELQDLVALPQGGLVLGGESYSYPIQGTKTSPYLGTGDHWFVHLAAENPEDCDVDGVPNSRDGCTNTPLGAVVDAHGCSIVQHCPCDHPWADHAAYVECVRTTSSGFVTSGWITEEERIAILAMAENAPCPMIRPSIIFQGLTNVAKGDAQLFADDNGEGWMGISLPGLMGTDGVSVLLGEADSGLFIYPDANIWGEFSSTWFMTGTAYGSLDGQPGMALSTVRGTKPHYEHYPIDVDLSPLAPASLTFQVFRGTQLETEVSVSGTTGRLTVHSSQYLGPRVNPLWIQADGSVGVLVEFTEASSENGYPYLSGPFGQSLADRVFIRADHPAHTLDHVSHVDVVGGGGFSEFSFRNLNLGVFHRPHQALGKSLFEARGGRLTMRRMRSTVESEMGVMVELKRPRTFEVDLDPVTLREPGASLRFHSAGQSESFDNTFASTLFQNRRGRFHLDAELSVTNLEIKSFKNGILTASHALTNRSSASGFLLPADRAEAFPAILSVGFQAGTTTEIPATQFLLDQSVTWTLQDGSILEGDQFRIEGSEALGSDIGLTSMSMLSFGLPAFTINGEREDAPGPALNIEVNAGDAVLSWPQRSAPYVLEAAPSVTGVYQPVDHQRSLQSGLFTARLPLAEIPLRFFRLRPN